MNTTLADLCESVHGILRRTFGEVRVDGDSYSIRSGSSRLFVKPWSTQNGQLIVNLVAPLLFHVPLSPELFHYVATHADDYLWCNLAVVEGENEATLSIVHSLLGNFLDPDELGYAVGAMSTLGDELDDKLQVDFGGVKYYEA